MIKGDRNGFGNDSHCTFLTNANNDVVHDEGGSEVYGYFYDSSKGNSEIDIWGNGHYCKLSGATKQEGFGKFGGACWDVTGSTEWKYIEVTGNTGGDDWSFASDDFCIDFWIRIHEVFTSRSLFGSNGTYSDNNNYWGIAYDVGQITTGTGLTFVVKNSGFNVLVLQWDPDGDISLDTWYHCAVTRRNNTFRLFWDGIMRDSTVSSIIMPHFNEAYLIGAALPSSAPKDASFKRLSAYYDEFRITKGNPRWTSDFTLPDREY